MSILGCRERIINISLCWYRSINQFQVLEIGVLKWCFDLGKKCKLKTNLKIKKLFCGSVYFWRVIVLESCHLILLAVGNSNYWSFFQTQIQSILYVNMLCLGVFFGTHAGGEAGGGGGNFFSYSSEYWVYLHVKKQNYLTHPPAPVLNGHSHISTFLSVLITYEATFPLHASTWLVHLCMLLLPGIKLASGQWFKRLRIGYLRMKRKGMGSNTAG